MRLWTHLGLELLHSGAGHRGLLRGFFSRVRDQDGGMCGIEDTATQMKKWKWKHYRYTSTTGPHTDNYRKFSHRPHSAPISTMKEVNAESHKPVDKCSEQHYTQEPQSENSPNVHQQMSDSRVQCLPRLQDSVQFSHSVLSNSFQLHESQHARPRCPSPTPEFILTHVHRVGDATQPFHPLSSPSPPAPNPSQHQGLFQ